MSDPTDISNSAAVSDLLAGLRRDLQAAAAGDQPAPFPTPPPRLTSAAISIAVSCAQNAIAAAALAKLTTNLHTLGAPVPALTHRQIGRAHV